MTAVFDFDGEFVWAAETTRGGPDNLLVWVPEAQEALCYAGYFSGTPTERPSKSCRAELHGQSIAFETRPARTGFKCMYCSFSSSFASL